MIKIGGVSETNNIQVSQTKSIQVSQTKSIQDSKAIIYSTTDVAIKEIKKKISDANQELMEISLDKDIPTEEKMKIRQELQKEIRILYQKLRKLQIEQRKEQQAKKID